MTLTEQQIKLIKLGQKTLDKQTTTKFTDKLWHLKQKWIKNELIKYYESNGNSYETLSERTTNMTLEDFGFTIKNSKVVKIK